MLALEATAARSARDGLVERLCDAVSPERVLPKLRRAWPALREGDKELEALIVERVYPHADQGFVIHYEARLRQRGARFEQTLFAELPPIDVCVYAETVRQKLRKSRRGQCAAAKRPANLFVVEDLGLLFRVPGLDERIAGLKLFHDTGHALKALAEVLPSEGDSLGSLRTRLISHRLRKRCVVRFDLFRKDGAPAGSLFAKMYKTATDKALTTHRATAALHGHFSERHGPAAIPRPIHFFEDNVVSILGGVDGRSLENEQQPCDNDIHGVANALRSFHNCGIRVEAQHGVSDERCILEHWTALVETVFPELAHEISSARAAVFRALEGFPNVAPKLCHRDFHQKQVLFRGQGLVLIDFDTLAMGDPAIDIGNFLAHLRWQAWQDGDDPRPIETAFLAGYGDELPHFAARIEGFARAAQLRLACLYAFSSTWGGLARRTLALASG